MMYGNNVAVIKCSDLEKRACVLYLLLSQGLCKGPYTVYGLSYSVKGCFELIIVIGCYSVVHW